MSSWAGPSSPRLTDVEDERRAVIFGRDAANYEAARPSYPPAAIEHVRSLVDASTAVEVGAGTGKATGSMATEGLRIICLEPSPQMASLLESKALTGVEVVVSTFEDWDGGLELVDLIYAAQAWHWVDPAIGFGKAMSVLRPGGVIALMWNVPLDRYSRHVTAYRRFAPHLLEEVDERIKRRDSHDWREDMEEAGFIDAGLFSHEWSAELATAEYRALYASYSDHMLLEEPARTRLLDALADEVDKWGGTTSVEYVTHVYSGRKPDPAQR